MGMVNPLAGQIGMVLWVLSSLCLVGALVAYVMWRSWQSAHHTKRQAQQGRQPVADVTAEARGGEEIHP